MSNIEWTDATWNPVAGCTRASRGCDRCYAVGMTHRLGEMAKADRDKGRDPGRKAKYEGLTVLNGRGDRHFNGQVRTIDAALPIPLGWRTPRRVFVNSMGDLFHPDVPFDFIDRVFAVMALCPQHTFQVLTKRPERMAQYLDPDRDRAIEASVLAWHTAQGPDYAVSNRLPMHPLKVAEGLRVRAVPERYRWPLPNVWLGTSCEDQEAADERIPHLLRCPAAVRFLSCEPLLGPIDLNKRETICKTWSEGGLTIGTYIDWVIAGGESGKGALPCDVAWIRSLIEQCRAASVPVFVKQLGSVPVETARIKEPTLGMAWSYDDSGEQLERWFRPKGPKGGDMAEWPEDLRVREMPREGAAR